MEDAVDPGAGILMKKKIGDFVKKGEPLALLYTNLNDSSAIEERIRRAFIIGEEKREPLGLIQGRIPAEGLEPI